METDDAASITRVTWLRHGAVTHAFDESQTFEDLKGFERRDKELTVRAPKNTTATPGPYLLFIINGKGVPSVAKTVFIHE